MKSLIILSVAFVTLAGSMAIAAEWDTKKLHGKFYTEGASAGDIDGDGHFDLIAGPFWYRGPGFEKSFTFTKPREYPVQAYSDNFFSGVFDANGDKSPDILVIGFPGKSARLYVNPGKESLAEDWAMSEVADVVDNESPAIVDFIPGGLPEIVCGRGGKYGYYSAGDNATAAWTWNPVTEDKACGGRFTHAMGVGDVNQDGKLDILDRAFWWEHPKSTIDGVVWKKHRWAPENYGGGGAQIHVEDVDGDGDADIVTSLNAHAYGLAWFEQTEAKIFQRHDIMGKAPEEHDHGVAFSQLHAVAMKDMDGDGVKDIVTGKRYFAHGGKDPGGLDKPVLYWFKCVRINQGVKFVPHLIHEDSGVGTDVLVEDLNDDKKPDVVTSSKRGLVIHFQKQRDSRTE